jgi:glycosyltransferase involved in cell wall biosynthesis
VVAIPAYNEEVSIGSIVLRAKVYTDMVVVVDDGSTDSTANVARLAGAEVVVHERNRGYGAAIKTCFETARQLGAGAMVIIDADGQHDPKDIPRLIDGLMQSKSDVVIGSRFVNGNGKKQKIPMYRKLGMKVLDTVTNIGTGIKISDSQSGFRAYSRRAIQKIQLNNSDMAAGSEILINAVANKLTISEVPISVRYDLQNSSTINPISHGVGVLKKILGSVAYRRPMIFFFVPGAIMLAITLAIATLLVANYYNAHTITPGLGVGAIFFAVGGMLSTTTGLVLSSKRRAIKI